MVSISDISAHSDALVILNLAPLVSIYIVGMDFSK